MAGPAAALLNLGNGTTPASPPPVGFTYVWISDADGLMYKMDSGGAVSAVGSISTSPLALTPLAFAVPVPPVGQVSLYASSVDRKVYSIDSFGVTSGPFGAGGGATIGWGYGTGGPGALYVDMIAGNDGTAVFYDQSKPYLTVNAALADATDGDIIVLGPGTHVTGPLNFGGLTDITIIGQGIGVTSLDTTSISPLINITTAFTRLRLYNMTLHSKNSSTIVLDGTGLGTGNFINGLTLNNLEISSDASAALFLQYVGGIDMSDVFAVGSGVVCFETCSYIAPVRNCTLLGSATRVSWDDASTDKPTSGRTPAVFLSVTTGTNSGLTSPLHLRNHPWAIFDENCSVGSIDTDFGLTVAGGLAPKFEFHGTADYVNLPAGVTGIPDTAIAQIWNFDGARFRALSAGQAINVGIQAPAANPQTVLANNTKLPTGGGYAAGANITLEAGGNQPDCIFGGFGVFKPGQWTFQYMGPPAGNGVALAWTGGLTTVNPPKQVIVTPRSDIAAAPPGFDNMGVGLFTTTGFTLWYTGAAGVNDFIDVTAIF